MADDLRTRIAAAAVEYFKESGAYFDHYTDDNSIVDGNISLLDLADVLIRELALTPEHSYGTTYPNIPVEDRRLVRYVTEWTADEVQ